VGRRKTKPAIASNDCCQDDNEFMTTQGARLQSNNETAVCLVCDTRFNPYACFTAASISALPEHSGLDIFIFTESLADSEAAFIKQFRNVHPIIIEDLKLPFSEPPSNAGLSMATFYVFFLDRLLPPGKYRRVIYLDCDIFVSGSILDLVRLDLEGQCLAAVRAIGMAGLKSQKQKSELRRYWDERGIAGDPTLNAGVLVIDLPQWRELDMEQRLISTVLNHPGIDDEEAFNIVLQHQWLELSPKWNFFAFQLGLGLEPRIQPVIHHYMASPKPWHALFWHHDPVHRKRYLSFFENSPWPDAATVRVHRSKLRRCAIKKAQYLRKMHSPLRKLGLFHKGWENQPWLRNIIIDLYNEGVESRRFADHRQGLTKLSRIRIGADGNRPIENENE
jgi:UDP-D-galactose:(glucosyl)LPS alpha-1,3-D-galactosyltransferase